jgi:cell division septation protein DedD
MLSILTQESLAQGAVTPEPLGEPTDFEIVLGRRQLASVLFVATVIVVVFSAVFYLAGKSASPKRAPVAAVAPAAAATPAQLPAPAPAPVVAATSAEESPLFAEPQTGALYIQIGALETGISKVLVEGLRTHRLEAFVAPGPNDKIFRVLIGPLPDPDSFMRAKDIVDQIGLSSFARKYQP